MIDTTGRIPLWLIGAVLGIPMIGLVGIFLRFIFRIGFITVGTIL